jgi:hypothetical protein
MAMVLWSGPFNFPIGGLKKWWKLKKMEGISGVFKGNPKCGREPMCGNAADFAAEDESESFG